MNCAQTGCPQAPCLNPALRNQTGTLTWTPTFDQAGYYRVDFYATNESGGWASTELVISDSDRPPVVIAPAEVQGVEGEELVFDATVADPDGGPILAFVGEGLPAGSVLSTSPTRSSAHFSWTPRSGEAGIYVVTMIATSPSTPPRGILRSDSATTVITVASRRFAARAYILRSESPIRLGSGGPRACVQLEPLDGDFDLGVVDPTTVKLALAGAGSTDRIQAQVLESDTPSDRDNNGVTDLSACFAKADLRRLFESIQGGRQSVHTTISGELLRAVRSRERSTSKLFPSAGSGTQPSLPIPVERVLCSPSTHRNLHRCGSVFSTCVGGLYSRRWTRLNMARGSTTLR